MTFRAHPTINQSKQRYLRVLSGALLLGLGAVPQPSSAAVVRAEVVLQQGETPPGFAFAVASIGPPFALADGTVAMVGALEDGDAFVFIDDEVVWLNSDEVVLSLSGFELAMGASVSGGYIYGPAVDGADSVWTHNGLLAQENVQAPGFPAGTTSTFHSRPTMTSDGVPYWLAGTNASGAGTTEARVIYRSLTGLPADIEVVLASGDVINGLTVESPAGVDFDFQVSPDGAHLIAVVSMDTGSSSDNGHIYFDGGLLHREASPDGTGTNWDNFDLVTTNNAGDYAFSGDTEGSTATDEFIAVNGAIAIREGQTIDGVALEGASVRLLALADTGRLAHGWLHDAGETVFFACDGSDPAGSSQAILSTDIDELDFDGDGVGDGVVTDMDASNLQSSRSLNQDGAVYLEVDLDDATNMLVRIPVTCCGNGTVDFDETCDDGNGDDSDECPASCEPATCGDGFVWAGNEDCDDGNGANTDACLTDCTPASCGDGFLWAGVEECDDANGDDTDACPQTCMLAECGDGFVWAGQETCDDGNDSETDGCLNNCTMATCGDGLVWEGMEDCDDGNTDDGDECPSDCMLDTGTSSSDGGESSSSGDGASSSDSGGTTGGDGNTGSSTGGAVDDTVGNDDTTGPGQGSGDSTGPGPGSSTSDGSSGGSPFPGLDDDGGCACRAPGSDGRGAVWGVGMLLLLGGLRRRRHDDARPASGHR